MEIKIEKTWFQEEEQRVLVDISYREQQSDKTWHSAKVSVLLEWNDSYAEIRRQAIEKATEFLTRCSKG